MSNTAAANALERYSDACAARDKHITENPGVFKAHEAIVNRILDARNALEDAVIESGAGVSNGDYRVTLTNPTQEICNFEVLKTKYPGIYAEVVTQQKRPAQVTIGRQPRGI